MAALAAALKAAGGALDAAVQRALNDAARSNLPPADAAKLAGVAGQLGLLLNAGSPSAVRSQTCKVIGKAAMVDEKASQPAQDIQRRKARAALAEATAHVYTCLTAPCASPRAVPRRNACSWICA